MRLNRVVGLPAVLHGRTLGHVERAVLEKSSLQLRGFTVRRGLMGARWVSRENVAVLGEVSVVLRAEPVRLPRDTDFTLGAVMDESGLTLGLVTDLWICPESLGVTALEVSLGPLEDLRHGRRRVRAWTVIPGDGREAQLMIPRSEWEVRQ